MKLADYNQQADELVQMILATGFAPAILSVIDKAEEKARCKESLAEFVKRAWQEIEPESSKLIWNWHLDVICAYMEAVYDGRIKRLIINISPGTMKSLVVMVLRASSITSSTVLPARALSSAAAAISETASG